MKLQADELKISSSGAPSRRVFRARLMEIDPELDHDFLKAAAVSAQSPLPRLDLTPLLLHLSGFERGYVVLSGQGHCWVAVTGLKKETDNRMVVILLGKDPDHDIGYHEFRGSALETVLV
ncbi:hypothetical protein OIDMADRAFT_54732 [Oidiodendron maius Zn]|uniref:Uncharacterized protein n=1 Tax=Oidiodendron maius (strain Zn) TaxID=913774 RepID=A0A0C3HCW6_OIDMZ|nr:hypothetical protein OIDMADRAFT_54732 [Oidiodendron maius Zn]